MRLRISDEVQTALDDGHPVVALETAVITHGLPRPHAVAVADLMGTAIRRSGAVPALVAVLDGGVHVGLSAEELDRLTPRDGPAQTSPLRKISLRDLPGAVAGRATGGTTVAATVWAAHIAGIDVFATGGIGGVHRGRPHDVSADLAVLGRVPICVVCSGPKSVLDVEATLEILESLGVPVVGYRTAMLPAFYLRESNFPAHDRVDGPLELAALLHARDSLDLDAAVLVAVPCPEAEAVDPGMLASAIERAEGEAATAGVRGADLTPFILSRLSSLTSGRSIVANVALLEENARVAGEIAVALLAE